MLGHPAHCHLSIIEFAFQLWTGNWFRSALEVARVGLGRSVMACPRKLYVAAGAVAGLGSAVWLSAIGSLVVHVILVPATVVVAMLIAAAGALLVEDWRADLESRQAWAEFAPLVAQWNGTVGREPAHRVDPRYLSALDNDAVHRVLRIHRSAIAVAPVQAIAEPCSASAISPPAPVHASDAAPTATCSGEISTAEVSRRGQIELARAPTAAILVASDRRVAVARCAEHGVRTRVVVHGSGWSAPVWSVLTRPTPWQPARIIVLGARQGDQTTPAEAEAGGEIGSSAEPPSCRGPPSRQRSSHAKAVTTPQPSISPAPGTPALSGGDPVVRDNLGEPIPVTAAEVDVIETYLGPLLDELLGSRSDSKSREA